jgi:FtsH-binding integral membrane protein
MDAWSTSAPLGRTRTAEFMAAVYRWMAFGLALTGMVAWAITTSPALLSAFYRFTPDGRVAGTSGLFLLVALATLGMVFAFSAVVQRASLGVVVGMFLGYCALMGVTFSVYLLLYTGASVASTFFITGGAFFALSLYGTVTKRDLSAWRTFLMIGLIGVLLASVVNIFLHSNAVEFVLTCAGVVVFAGLTAYDTQKIRAMGESGDERLALRGALVLYLDFINLFVMLLRLFGRRRD